MQNIIPIRSPKSNKIYKLTWDRPTPPTDQDIDDFLTQMDSEPEQVATPPSTPVAEEPKSALSRFGTGLGESLTGIGKLILNPAGVVQETANSLAISRALNKEAPGPVKPISNEDVIGGLANLIGIPVDRIQSGDYAGALGQATPDILMGLATSGAGRLTKARNLAESLAAKAAKDFTPTPKLEVPQAITDPSRLLPSQVESGPRFFAGKYGIGDGKQIYLGDTGPTFNIKDPNLTVLPEELGEPVRLDPITAAQYGTSSPPTRLPMGKSPEGDIVPALEVPQPITDPSRLLPIKSTATDFFSGPGGVTEPGKNYTIDGVELPADIAAQFGEVKPVVPMAVPEPIRVTLVNPSKKRVAELRSEGYTTIDVNKKKRSVTFEQSLPERITDESRLLEAPKPITKPYDRAVPVSQAELDAVRIAKERLEVRRNPVLETPEPIETPEMIQAKIREQGAAEAEALSAPKPIIEPQLLATPKPIETQPLLAVAKTREAIAARKAARKADSVLSAVDEVVAKLPDEIKTVVGKSLPKVEAAVKKSAWRDSLLKQGYDKVGTSRGTVIANLGPAGKEATKLLHTVRTEGNRLGGEFASRIRTVGRNLTPDEELKVVKALDGKLEIARLMPKEMSAYIELRNLTEALGKLGEESGMHLITSAGKSVPFKRMAGEYFPHQFPPGFWDNDVEGLIDKIVKGSNGKITVDQAKKLVQRSREYGERYISPQHQRTLGHLTGYYERLHALEKYAYDMGTKITQAKMLGAKDVADPNSTISKLIVQTTDPVKAHTQISKILGRGPIYDNVSHRVAQAVTKAEVFSHLSQVAISTIADLGLNPIRSNYRILAKSVAEVLSNPHGAADTSTSTGALRILRYEALKDVEAGNLLGKVYGIAPMEKFLRTVNAISGRTIAQDLFAQLKKSPNNARARRRLGTLIDEDLDSLLKQDSLTREQIDFAGGRMAELTSSIPDDLTLPSAFTGHPIANLAFLFKRFAFTTTKNIISAAKNDPIKIPALIATYLAMGEMTGDIKATIKGTVKGAIKGDVMKGISEEVMGRHKYMTTGNEIVDRALTNAMQSWLFGMLGDTYETASKGSRGLHKFSVVASDVGEGLDVTKSLLAPSDKAKKEGTRADPLKKAVLRRVPFIGSGLAAAQIKPEPVRPIR